MRAPLNYIFERSRVFYSIQSIARNRYKLHQLWAAKRIGLKIPRTFLGNKPPNRLDKYAIKPVSGVIFPGQGGMFTEVVSARYLSEHQDQLSVAPMFIQEYVEKDYELRVLATRDDVASLAIHSQAHELNRADWRVSQHINVYEPADIKE